MNNQVAINFLDQARKILLDDKSWLESTIQPINEAFDMAISALRAQDLQQTCNKLATDTIYRQAAINAVDAIRHIASITMSDGDKCIRKSTAKYVLSILPSAQPEPYEDKLKEIADALSEKMCYMNTCPNERDIILGYLGRKRSRKNHCNTDCWNEKCESYHYETKQQPEPCEDAVSRADVEAEIANILKNVFVEYRDIAKRAAAKLSSVTPKRKTGEMSRSIDGSTLIMWLNDWWASSFGQEETPESKAIHEVLDKVAEYIGKRTLSEEPGYVESQNEEQILECCIGLMQEMADCFREYLEFIDHEPEYEEEKQPFCFSYFHIVNRLFLWHTSHSGGTSTRAKCKELGIDDSGKQVEFYIWEDEGDES